MSSQRSRPEQVERLVTRLAEDVHSTIGGRAFPAKLIQTAVSVLSNDKAVSSEKWDRVCLLDLFEASTLHNALICARFACFCLGRASSQK